MAALNPRIVNGKLDYNGKLGNTGFFSKTASEISTFKTYGPPGSKTDSSLFSSEYAAENKIKVVQNGAVTVNGQKQAYDEAKAFLQQKLANGRTIGWYGTIPGKVVSAIGKNIGKLGVGVALAALFVAAGPANNAQAATGYDTTKNTAANRTFISEVVGTVAGQLGGLIAGALTGLTSWGALAIPAAIAVSEIATRFGKYLGGLFYDTFTEMGNAAAEKLAPLFAPIGTAIVEFPTALTNFVSDVINLVSDKVFGRDGLFGIDGPLFGAGGPLHFSKAFLEKKQILTNGGMWTYDGFDAILYGEDTDDVLVHEGWGSAYGGKGDDILVGWRSQPKDAGDPLFEDSSQPTAIKDSELVLNGEEGNDWIIAIGGEEVQTIGGKGRDWIVNWSNGGVIYGDTIDGVDPVTGGKVEDNAANSDNIWYSPNTVVKDAQHHDVLKFYGLTLTGGNAEGGVAGLAIMGGFGAVAGLANFAYGIGKDGKYHPENSIYFDHLFPWMTYAFKTNENGNLDLYISNLFDQVFTAIFGGNSSEAYKKQQALDAKGILKGWMKIENFDLVGSYIGFRQAELTGKGDFGMVFKAPPRSFSPSHRILYRQVQVGQSMPTPAKSREIHWNLPLCTLAAVPEFMFH